MLSAPEPLLFIDLDGAPRNRAIFMAAKHCEADVYLVDNQADAEQIARDADIRRVVVVPAPPFERHVAIIESLRTRQPGCCFLLVLDRYEEVRDMHFRDNSGLMAILRPVLAPDILHFAGHPHQGSHRRPLTPVVPFAALQLQRDVNMPVLPHRHRQ